MNFTNFTINVTSVYPSEIDCGSLIDYNVLQLCQKTSFSNVLVFGGLWLCFLVATVLHNFGKLSDERYINLMKSFVMAYVFLGTIALGTMIVTLL